MIIGHGRVLNFLKKSAEKKKTAHAYLFTGSAHLGKRTVALEFIKMLVGQEMDKAVHPDVLIIEPKVTEKEDIKKESAISISQAKEVQHQMNMFPYRADYKIALIDQAERMNIEAANCLLKTLEEPSGRAILILITANPQMLLPTIISRCQTVNFLPVAEEEILSSLRAQRSNLEENNKIAASPSAPRNDIERIVRLANGRPGLVINYLENPELLEEQNKIINKLEELLKADLNQRYQYAEEISKNISVARQILDHWIFWFRDLLLLDNNCSDLIINSNVSQYKGFYSSTKLKSIIKTIKNTNWLLANPSTNAKLALEVLMLEI